MSSSHGALSQVRRLVRRGRTGYVDSEDYWESRYARGGDSGGGSYGEVAEYKAGYLNRLVEDRGVRSVIEFGCGDGNQLSLAHYPGYLGVDVSKTAVERCASRFADDHSKSFMWYDPSRFYNNGAIAAELALSLDVILHLVEDHVYETYMRHLFGASTRLVVIFSPDREERVAPHVRYRRFTAWVEQHAPEWNLTGQVSNDLAARQLDTAAHFFIFERR